MEKEKVKSLYKKIITTPAPYYEKLIALGLAKINGDIYER